MNISNYQEEENQKSTLKLRGLMTTLPSFTHVFFRGIEPTTSTKTRIAYAYDLNVFFNYIISIHTDFNKIKMCDFEINYLDDILPEHIEMYLEYLTYYKKKDPNNKDLYIKHQNGEKGKARKIATLRTLYSYFYKKQKIRTNPVALIDSPKIHDKNIVMLEVDEVARLLDEIESGNKLSTAQKKYHTYTKLRDLALVSILLGTGMRVSECVGLNIRDIDFKVNGVKIIRKGGNEVVLYFGAEVEQSLLEYISIRNKMISLKGHEYALFLSLQRKRLSVRSIQNIVKKYSALVTTLKNISPHKLRSTYGTTLYRETGDIYLVADVLGHKDVNTTKKHYAQIEDERRRKAARIIKLLLFTG